MPHSKAHVIVEANAQGKLTRVVFHGVKQRPEGVIAQKAGKHQVAMSSVQEGEGYRVTCAPAKGYEAFSRDDMNTVIDYARSQGCKLDREGFEAAYQQACQTQPATRVGAERSNGTYLMDPSTGRMSDFSRG